MAGDLKLGSLVAYDYDADNVEWVKEFGAGQCWTPRDRRECNHTGRVVHVGPGFVRVERITDPLLGEQWSAPIESVVSWVQPSRQGSFDVR